MTEHTQANHIITTLIGRGYTLQLTYDDAEPGEDPAVPWTTDPAAFPKELCATGIDLIHARKGDQRGTLMLVWGNASDGSELLADYGATPKLDTLLGSFC